MSDLSNRSTIYPILTRLGIDLLVGRITHLRDDERFKAVGPDAIVLPYPHSGISNSEGEKEAEIWFDWAFVDFWKSNYCERSLSHWNGCGGIADWLKRP